MTTRTSVIIYLQQMLPSRMLNGQLNVSSSIIRGAHNPNNEFQHGGNVLHCLKMQAVSCLEKNHFMLEFGKKCRTLNVLLL